MGAGPMFMFPVCMQETLKTLNVFEHYLVILRDDFCFKGTLMNLALQFRIHKNFK